MSNPNQETTPDQLMEAFRGRSLKSIIIFTLIVHIVVLGGTSVPFFLRTITGKSASKLSEQDRTELAAREATSALRDIAAKHGLKPQDLSSRIAGGAAPKAAAATAPAPSEEPEAPAAGEEEKPKSAIEEQLEVKEDGPQVPPIPSEEAEDDDLFK